MTDSIAQMVNQTLKAEDTKSEPEKPVTEEEPRETSKTDPKVETEEVTDPETEETVELELEEPEEPKKTEVPPANKFVYDKLPFITVRGKVGEGKIKDFRIKVPDELPDDFEFASPKDQAVFNGKLADQANLASKYFAEYEKNQQDDQMKSYQAQEEREILSDMIELQKQGVLPKFKYESTDSRFNDDEAVKEINKIIKYHEKLNKEFIENGQMYRVPFRLAVSDYYAKNPKKAPEVNEKSTKEKEERQKIAGKVAGNGGTTAKSSKGPRYNYYPGMSLRAIALHEADAAGMQ